MTFARTCLAAVFLHLAWAGVSVAQQPSQPQPLPAPTTQRPRVLVTGFAPFGPWRTNPSWEGARRLHGAVIAGHEVVAVELPVRYLVVWRTLPRLIERYRPVAVLHFGMNPRPEGRVLVEQRARNGRYYTPDATRRALAPRCDALVEDGPFWRRSTLPARALVAAFTRAGIPARVSDDAGYYLCEFTLFRSLHLQARRAAPAPTGFLHVPQAWPLDEIERAMRVAIEATLAASPAPPASASPADSAPTRPDVPDERLRVRGVCDVLR